MPKLYITEPTFVDGTSHQPGDVVDVSPDDAASVLSAGRGTLDKAIGAEAAKNAKAAAAAIAATLAAAPPAIGSAEFNAAVASAVAAALAAQAPAKV